jgi:hypothetical protein
MLSVTSIDRGSYWAPRERLGVEFGSGRSGCANRADDLITQPDHHTTAEEHDMGQLSKRRNWVLALCAISQGKGVVLKRYAGVRLVMRTIERVDASSVARAAPRWTRWHEFAILRRVLLRMDSWLNYVFNEGHGWLGRSTPRWSGPLLGFLDFGTSCVNSTVVL